VEEVVARRAAKPDKRSAESDRARTERGSQEAGSHGPQTDL